MKTRNEITTDFLRHLVPLTSDEAADMERRCARCRRRVVAGNYALATLVMVAAVIVPIMTYSAPPYTEIYTSRGVAPTAVCDTIAQMLQQ